MKKRRDWAKIEEVIAKSDELKIPYTEGAKQFGVKLQDIYDYKYLKKKGKIEEPANDSEISTKKESVQLPEEIKNLIVEYRGNHPDHGFKRIADTLKNKHLIVVPRKQIRKVLKEAGLLETLDSSFDKKKEKGTKRFEAEYPSALYQMDIANVYIKNISVLYLVVIIDDNSRFCIAAELCRDQRADTLIGVLHNACLRHRKPEKLLTDQGSAFYTWSREQTQFQDYLDDQKIEHIVSDPHSPQTQGKVERLIQTIRLELLTKVKFTGLKDAQEQISSFIHSYNHDRPHQGIQGKKPADRFFGIAGEVDHIESELVSRALDPSRGYMIYKVQNQIVSIAHSATGLKVYVDGTLLKKEKNDDPGH